MRLIIMRRIYAEISQGVADKPRAYISAGIISVDASGAGGGAPLCAAVFVCRLPAYVAVGPGICNGLGVTVASTIGREGIVEEVGLGGLGEGQWG